MCSNKSQELLLSQCVRTDKLSVSTAFENTAETPDVIVVPVRCNDHDDIVSRVDTELGQVVERCG
jgi:hypothetical protein